jgi:hypothetical protein
MEENVMTRDPKDLWRNQHTEGVRMSAEEVRLRAEKFRKMIRWNTAVNLVAQIILISICVVVLLTSPLLGARLIVALAIAWMVTVRIRSRTWVHALFSNAESSLNFYRLELHRLREHYRNRLVDWFVGIVIISLQVRWIAVSTQLHVPTLNVVLLPVLMTIALVLYVLTRRRESRRLQREIDALEDYERE